MGMPFANNIELDILNDRLSKKIDTLTVFNKIDKISDYLYEIEFDNLDYEFANKHFNEDRVQIPQMACSGVRNGNWFGRNFDWFYNHDLDFVVRTTCKGRIPSIGVAGSISELFKGFIESHSYSDFYKLIPFYTLDGINQAGVFISTNVIPQDIGKVIKTVPTEGEELEMFLLMFPRFVLDKFTNATEACEYAQKHISFFNTKKASGFGYDTHFMIGDSEHTYVLEIIDNKVEFKEQSIMTNFHIIPTVFNEDGKVYTPATQDDEHNAIDTNHITQHGSGLERYNIAVDNLSSANTKEGMVNLMHNLLNYNNSYTTTGDDTWYTEFVGNYSSGNYTVKTPADKYEEKVMPVVRGWFENRNRDNNPQPVWHTTHTSVYDIQNRKLYVYDSTEDGVEHVFNFNKYYTAAEIDELLKNILNK